MGQDRKLFTKAFEEEAVRLVRTSGRTKREIAADLACSAVTCFASIPLASWSAQSRFQSYPTMPALGGPDCTTL